MKINILMLLALNAEDLMYGFLNRSETSVCSRHDQMVFNVCLFLFLLNLKGGRRICLMGKVRSHLSVATKSLNQEGYSFVN